MHSTQLITAISLFLLGGSPFASAATKAPAAPSNLTVKALGVNAFEVKWKDNSKNETGWEIRVSLKGGIPQRFAMVPSPNITSYVITTNDLPGKELVFQMTAYNGVAGQEVLSALTPVVGVKALSSNTFSGPTMLKAKVIDDGRIQLTWTDNSTSENGYQIESRIGTKKWTVLGNLGPGITFSILTSGYSPAETRSFRVRAFKAAKLTSYSNVATATTKAFQVPSSLVVTALPEGAFTFKWKDRSAVESGFEIQSKVGSGNFESLGTVAANQNETDPVPGFTPSTAHQFRVRAFRLVGTVKTYSGFSNVFSIQSTPLATPTTLAVSATSDSSATLTWVDKSSRETGYEILYRVVGTTPFASVFAAANAQTFTVGNLASAATYEFRVSAVVNGFFGNRIATSDYKSVQARTKEGFVGSFNPPILAGSSFLFPIQVSLPSAVTGLTVTGLPSGLTFNSGNGTITGILSTAGNYTATMTATFSDGTTATRSLTLKSISPSPTIVQSFAAVSVPVATPKIVSLAGKFSDPDTASAARVTTTAGTFDIILFPYSTPQTVDNFLDYTDAGEYDNVFFHRAPVNFVVQGGGFKYTPAGGFTGVNKFARTLPNEPGLSNVRGTVAMAKIGGDPNSATSEFFVNVNNNSGAPPLGLDFQNGGFTVFGRVPAAGMVVVDQISALPIHNYTIPIGTGTLDLTDVPVNAATAPAVLDPAQLVKITSVDAAPILTYEVLSQNTAIANASLTGTDITITGVAQGGTTIQVKAIDLDGNSVTQNIVVTVP
jgi:cyclophilin family peptidyl-prolyl cis-trans isomerase